MHPSKADAARALLNDVIEVANSMSEFRESLKHMVIGAGLGTSLGKHFHPGFVLLQDAALRATQMLDEMGPPPKKPAKAEKDG